MTVPRMPLRFTHVKQDAGPWRRAACLPGTKPVYS